MPLRYLEADQVNLPNRAPLFVEKGRCQWCNKRLTGRQRLYCSEECTEHFYNYWVHRPAYVRATFIRDNFTCQQCGLHPMKEGRPWLPDISRLECDHIIPLAKGGETTMDNLQTLCKECNRQKGIKVAGEEELPKVVPSRIPNNPLCGEDWLREHLADHTPEEIEALTIEVACDERRLPPVSVSDKRGTIKGIIKAIEAPAPRGTRRGDG